MRDDLLAYYEAELAFLRHSASEFAAKYPKIAGRLQIERDKCDDPHVERLLEASALLAARIHLKLDDDFPEISESLLQILYPHFLAPVPAMSIAQFELDPGQGQLSTGYRIERHRPVFSRPIDNIRCRFRTCYPVTLWPVHVEGAQTAGSEWLDATGRPAGSAITLRLSTQGPVNLSSLDIDELRFHLDGEARVTHRLYEALLTSCRHVELRDPSAPARPPVVLPSRCVQPVGFDADDGLLPYSRRSFLGYRLIQEYFHFPAKFLFLDLAGLHHLRAAGFGRTVEIVFVLDKPWPRSLALEARNFSLGCTPIVNLFSQIAEPVLLDHTATEYRVVPDLRHERRIEVYSIDHVSAISPATGETVEYQPFYSFKHAGGAARQATFWHAARRPAARRDDPGTEMYLTLVDLGFQRTRPPVDILTVGTTCTNGELPARITPAQAGFQVENAAPVATVQCVVTPTATVRPALGHGVQWRLISHLSLNYLSPAGASESGDPEVLREILRLYDFADSTAIQEQIAGLTGVSSRRVMRRVRTDLGSGLVRGLEVTLDLDEARFVGASAFLFASVLERFLALYVSVNSFTETIAVTHPSGVQRRWPPRSGQQALI